ncbi:hypothetical protein [Litorihabitans aurantiacus]|uniref:SMI1/KNR4 family protein n=1 Tax=Litorihabitans aurantiacus TaxID=1930061 RepID=A0AA37XH36_9MICO|nr:hypothetical protein [Litorihabitans aurantiacus]GMA32946.1 hypothetical protein GCM10025875_29380 [Litorihabitans aurantiacus]
MSRLADLMTPSLPPGLALPEPLLRAWDFMESRGWGHETAGGYVLTPYAGSAELGVVFSPSLTLAGWFEPGEPGHDRLVPLCQTDGTGSFAALWLDPDDAGAVRVVMLGSEGERSLLADDAVDFLRLVAIGYLELRDWAIEEEPDEEEDGESVAALADFRAWVEAELDVEVPAHWSVRDPDPFAAWVAEVKGEEVRESRFTAEPGPTAAPDVDPAAVVAALEELVDEPRITGVKFGRRQGISLTSVPWGHELTVIEPSGGVTAEHAPLVAPTIAAVRAALVARWGEPRTAPHVDGSRAANIVEVHGTDEVDLWDLGDDVVLGLFSSASEWTQMAVVVERRAVDVAHRY